MGRRSKVPGTATTPQPPAPPPWLQPPNGQQGVWLPEGAAMPDPRLKHPPGIVGVCADYTARYSYFTESCLKTVVPPGTKTCYMQGTTVGHGSNELCRQLIRETDAEWLWFLGDDHRWDPGLLVQLL